MRAWRHALVAGETIDVMQASPISRETVMRTELKLHWWQRHPFVGLLVGWTAIAALGADLVVMALRH
jgi:hypothetical protein